MNVNMNVVTELNNQKTVLEWSLNSLAKSLRSEADAAAGAMDRMHASIPGMQTKERPITLSDVGMIEAEIESVLAHLKKLQGALGLLAGENRKLDTINYARELIVASAGPSSVAYAVSYTVHYQQDINKKVKRDKNTIQVLVTDLDEGCNKAIETIHGAYEKYDNYSAEVRVSRTNAGGQVVEVKEFNLEWDKTEGEKRPEINY